MNCTKFEQLLCDYVDGTMRLDARKQLEMHAAGCPNCTEMLADAQWAAGFLRDIPAVEPPEELVTGILKGTAAIGGEVLAPAGISGGFTAAGWWRPLLRPWVEPRFAMSMAMAVLSLSMITYSGERMLTTWKGHGTGPVTIARSVQSQVDRAWTRSLEIYEMVRASYQIESAGQEDTPPSAERGAQKESAEREQPQ